MKHLKLFEEANDNRYYRKLTWDEQNYEWVGGFTSDRRNTWSFNKKDVLKVVSYFKDWDFYVKPDQYPTKDKFVLFILSEGTSLKWFCPDPKERKKIIDLDSTDIDLPISEIFIGGRMMSGYQIESCDDEYFTCSINDTWGNVDEFYECDQIGGLIELLKDKGVIS